MITLNISSKIEISSQELAHFFAEKNIKARIINTTSSVPDETDQNKHIVEYGFSLLIFDIDGKTFKSQVWDPLQSKLNLKCAFVKYRDDYMGCVLNWPGVFVESKCPGKIDHFQNTN